MHVNVSIDDELGLPPNLLTLMSVIISRRSICGKGGPYKNDATYIKD